MLAIVDYKSGNQTSVKRALEHLGISCQITDSSDSLDSYDGVIFPGVGAAAQAMKQLEITGFDKAIKRAVEKKQPLLGICLGCQILLEKSEEGDVKTLGILPGECRMFPLDMHEENGTPAKIPHMGWNNLIRKRDSRILQDVPEDAEFYFVHSYYTDPASDLVLATTNYGKEFCSVYGRDGLWAVQFHPEKSGRPGLQLLANFNAYCKEVADAL